MSGARVLGLALLAAALGCGPRTLAPEPVPLDRAHCAFCDMVISDDRNAAEAVSAAEDTRFYDDIGCLARDRAARAGVRMFLRSSDGVGWLRAEDAWLARPAGLETPMGHGIAAYASESDAGRADRHGRARRWSEVVREVEVPR